MVVTAGFWPLTTLYRRLSHERESIAQARSREAEAAIHDDRRKQFGQRCVDYPPELEFRHFASIPIADLARSHQSDSVMGDHVIEQSLKIFDAMRDTGDVGVNGDRHDPRVRCALKVQPIELIGTAPQKLLGRKML